MSDRAQSLIVGAGHLGILTFFCAMLAVYHGDTAGFVAWFLVVTAYLGGRSTR